MKRIRTGILILMILGIFAVPGFSFTTVAVDGTLDLARIAAVDVYANFFPADLLNITAGGAVPAGWSVYLNTPPNTWVAAAERLTTSIAPLVPGDVMTLQTTDAAFAITDILLWYFPPGSTDQWLQYDPLLYTWTSQAVGTDTVYTVSAVPIPAAAWLLGTGLVGLVGLSRRRRKR